MATIRVGVFGAAGRMGATVCEAVALDPDLDLVAAVDPAGAGKPVPGAPWLAIEESPDVMARAGIEVGIDFTQVEAARVNAQWCAANAVHDVIGTTGLSDSDLEVFREDFKRSNCLVAPNFAIGAVLMIRFAEMAAPYFESAEIIELHHDAKADAPSGTSLQTATRMASASSEWSRDPTRTTVVPGARGGIGPGGIHVHSVRLRGLVAHQEVLLGTTGQSLSIRHDSYDRSSFMPGVLLAVKAIGSHPGLAVGLDSYLSI